MAGLAGEPQLVVTVAAIDLQDPQLIGNGGDSSRQNEVGAAVGGSELEAPAQLQAGDGGKSADKGFGFKHLERAGGNRGEAISQAHREAAVQIGYALNVELVEAG